jgi:hypothetical protein
MAGLGLACALLAAVCLTALSSLVDYPRAVAADTSILGVQYLNLTARYASFSFRYNSLY